MSKMIKLFLLIGVLFSLPAYAVEKINVTSQGTNDFNFNHKYEYLNINITSLSEPKTDAPSWWDRLWGRDAKYGLIYVEYIQGDNTVKIPLFMYSAKSSNNYDINNIATLKDKISFPLLRNYAYNPNTPPKLKLVVHYWENEAKADLIKKMIGATELFGGITAAKADEALGISTMLVDLIEDMWPSDNKKMETTFVLLPENINKDTITFGIPANNGKTVQPIMTVNFSKNKGYFVDKELNSALDEFKDNRLNVWKISLIEVDNNLSETGIQPLFNQLRAFSTYISDMPLVYADKVLLLARAIDNWATLGIQGVKDSQGNITAQLSMAHYRKLDNSSWSLIESTPKRPLRKLKGIENCNTGHCREMSMFLSQSSMEEDITDYLPKKTKILTPEILDDSGKVIVAKVDQKFTPTDYQTAVSFNNDSSWTSLEPVPNSFNKWEAHFAKGKLKIAVNDINYSDHNVRIVMVKSKDKYVIQSITIS
ncbi:hypothetical protein [Terasakiella sp. SH-1]|uniref:hypothetical protein n=1 Tax=Terasakiella sp. SH-1 TaxID=2560057 RepID=UPI0010731F29|nr:hypothetical protein [Terasakiella sp. SH-1]